MNTQLHNDSDPIIALATGMQSSAIAVIRLSGSGVIQLVAHRFSNTSLATAKGNTIHYGKIYGTDGQVIDESLIAIYKAPHSYTKEDSVEISCHGSSYIVQAVINAFIQDGGVRLAEPGEFTMRAFMNGQLDLAQAEAVGDLIASRTSAQHRMALNQLRGGFSRHIQKLRQRLVKFASLIELENDFGEEDVIFADRQELSSDLKTIMQDISQLKDSFNYGNAIKEGVPIAIIGRPNAGKSTLLNALLQDDKAIVSAVPGTTRDIIEDSVVIDGISLRFFDTAGIRATEDEVEQIGINKTFSQLEKSAIAIVVIAISEDHQAIVQEYQDLRLAAEQKAIIVLNKTDEFHSCHAYDVEEAVSTLTERTPTLAISAKTGQHLDKLKEKIVELIRSDAHMDQDVVVSNLRHHDALARAHVALHQAQTNFDQGMTSDILAIDLRHAMHHLGEISGEITTDDLLDSIFRDFCIGK